MLSLRNNSLQNPGRSLDFRNTGRHCNESPGNEPHDIGSCGGSVMRLKGLRIIVTRSQTQAAGLTELLQREGAIVFEIPAIKIVPDEKAIDQLRMKWKQAQQYEWLILTSVNSVEIVQKAGIDWKDFKIACIGKATAKRVEEFSQSRITTN